MPIGHLSKIKQSDRQELIARLLESQNNTCYICQDPINLDVQGNDAEVDHITPLAANGPDEESNYAIVHGDCNRRKLASHLYVARQLMRFERLSKKCLSEKQRTPTLEDLLVTVGGGKAAMGLSVTEKFVEFSLSQLGDHEVHRVPLLHDPLSKVKTFFAELPLGVLYHDHRINPRSIGSNIRGLLEEFHGGKPQLHVSLGWVETKGENAGKVHVFDGQHKAAAQILLRATTLPMRVFVDPDLDLLLEANTNAGSKLRQVAFDKASLRNLGSSLYRERIGQYQEQLGLAPDNLDFTETDLYRHFKGQSKEIKRYIADAVRYRVIHQDENAMVQYVEFAGKGTERPVSYSAIDKTFFSQFICQDPLDSPVLGADPHPRDHEARQLSRLMTIAAEQLLCDRYSFDIGTYRLENRVAGGENIPSEHLAGVRLCREEVMQAWVASIKDILTSYLANEGKITSLYQSRLLHHEFPEQAFANVRNFLCNLRRLQCWSNVSLSETVFGGKPNYEYWRNVFLTGKTPAGVQVLAQPVNLIEMIQPPPQ